MPFAQANQKIPTTKKAFVLSKAFYIYIEMFNL